ncbi:MAG: hypothetical protein JWP80_2078 [Pseudomonas sp.]|nr:hypothetical protein [Pseudomonas sp.]
MTESTNTHLLFPSALQSSPVSKLTLQAGQGKEQGVGALSFAQVLKQQTPSTYPPPETGTYTRSAKATEVREWVLDTAAKDPEKAQMWANLYAYNSFDGPLLDCSELPIMRLSATGEIYTPEMRSYYGRVSLAMQAGLSALYESEIAKGTPAVKILDKIFAYNDALPKEFRRISDW